MSNNNKNGISISPFLRSDSIDHCNYARIELPALHTFCWKLLKIPQFIVFQRTCAMRIIVFAPFGWHPLLPDPDYFAQSRIKLGAKPDVENSLSLFYYS